jgi:acetyl esterase
VPVSPDIPNWDPPADVEEARRSWEDFAARHLNTDLPKIGALHEGIVLRPGLAADIMVPSGPPPFPTVLYLHGGGWAFGSARSFRKVGMTFAANGFLAVMLDYRLAPEHPFPAALDDVATAVDWIGANAAHYGGAGDKVAIGGDSAGANLALASALRGSDAFRARLSALLLLYGVYDLAGALARADNHPGLVLQVRNYIGGTAIDDPLVSPMFATFPRLPPCFVLEGGADPFVGGEAAALFTRLMSADTERTRHELQIVDGAPHGMLQHFGSAGCEKGWQLLVDFLQRK